MQQGRERLTNSCVTNANSYNPEAQAVDLQVSPADRQRVDELVQSLYRGASSIQDHYPLSPLQHGILFHHLENEGHDAYVLSVLLSAQSRSHIDLLAQRLNTVINRHDVLRTAIVWEHLSQPLQVVHSHVVLPVHEIPLRPGEDPAAQLREQARSGRIRFDLQHAPLMRLWVADQSNGSEWYAVFQIHHIVCDQLSLMEILMELAASLEGRAQPLPASIPFKDYVARSLLHTNRSEAEAFFRSKLKGIDATIAPFGITETRIDASTVQEHRLTVDAVVSQGVRTIASRYGISPGRLFHAAWSMVVAHTSGCDDVVFGTVLLAAEQRARNAADGVLLGPCINSLPLRVSLRGVSAIALATNVSRDLRELLAYDAVPLAVAQRCSDITNGSAPFTTLLNFRRGDSQYRVSIAEEVGVRVVSTSSARTGYPIAVSVNDFGEGFELLVNTDQRISPQRIASYLEAAMSSLAHALQRTPDQAALDLSILPDFERHLLLTSFNDRWADYPRTNAVHEIFEAWATRCPDAPAIKFEGTILSYRQLNRQANQLARQLMRYGAKVGDYIPVVMPRSAEMIIAQLAILKCGCVYVPVDPEFPAERQAFIFDDCAARIVLVIAQPQTDDLTNIRYVDLVAMHDELSQLCDDNLGLMFASPPPAYVMYTSGSTGIPKGVIVPHHAVVRLVVNNGYARLCSDDCFIHYSNPAFDASTFEIWGALLNGARVVIVPQLTELDPRLFERVLMAEQVSVLWMTVGLFNQCAEALASVFPRLRYVIVGGDRVDAHTIGRVLMSAPPEALLNAYGPTEGTTFTTTHRIGAVDCEAASIPIGRPIANAQVYVLDSRMQPIPIGVAGELYIGGDGVATGYLNRPPLTAERFVADPFSHTPGKRLYRTGDLVSSRLDGKIEFLGRRDDQVKIRGFRVELGEIQVRIEQHSAVKDALVVTREDESGQKQIVCYFTELNERQSTMTDDLREHVKAALPHYMVPSAFIAVDKLPLNANGKIDRNALPAPSLYASGVDTHEPPQGEIEIQLADIWRKLLGIPSIGRHDNFFELGAHSLHVLQVLMRMRERHDIPISVKDVYNCPTIHELANRLQGTSLDLQQVDLYREAVLPRTVAALPGICTSPPRNILVTGSTGFVGRFLLRQLLQNTDTTAYCLLRCQSKEHGFKILKERLIAHDLWDPELAERIIVVPGDLRHPHLGIGDLTYEFLSRSIDSIYHCATSMNHLETYAMAKPANVGGVIELLKLATQYRPKLLNYTSTASVFSPGSHAHRVNEHSPIDHESHSVPNGYAASKWVGEKLFRIASERGIPCNIFRLGLIWADTQFGRYDELQRGHRLLKSCLMSGFGIENYRFSMPPTPVDYAAQAIVHLANAHPDGQGTFHISSSSQMRQGIFEYLNEGMGLSLKIVPFYDWIREIQYLHAQGHSLPVVPLVDFAFSMDAQAFEEYLQRTERQRIEFDAALTHAELARAGIAAPALDDRLLRLCVERMVAEDEQLSARVCLAN